MERVGVAGVLLRHVDTWMGLWGDAGPSGGLAGDADAHADDRIADPLPNRRRPLGPAREQGDQIVLAGGLAALRRAVELDPRQPIRVQITGGGLAGVEEAGGHAVLQDDPATRICLHSSSRRARLRTS